MSLNLFRRLDRFDRRIRQLERTEPAEGGGGGGDHADSDHADAFSALSHAHSGVYALVEHDPDHDDRFSQLIHFHSLESLSDVSAVTAPLPDGYVLTWAVTQWTAMAPTVTAHGHDVASGWTSVAGSYGTGWGAAGGADQAPRYRTELGGGILAGDAAEMVIRLDGVAARSSGTGTVIFTLPIQYRPSKIKRFHNPSGTAAAPARIAVDTDGTVSQTAGTDFTRTSLEGITFPVDPV